MQLLPKYVAFGILACFTASFIALAMLGGGGEEAAVVEENNIFALKQARELNYGESRVAWLMLEGGEEGNISIKIYEQEQAGKIVLLKGPWVGAERFDEFTIKMREASRTAGWQFSLQDWQELSSSAQGRVIIIPSGAWPAGFGGEEELHFGERDLVLYFGIFQNASIDKDGALMDGGAPECVVRGKKALDRYAFLDLGCVGLDVGANGRTLDEFEDLQLLSQKIIKEILPGKGVMEEYAGGYDGGANIILGVSGEGQKWARISISDEKKLLRVWDVELLRLQGDVEGAKSASPSSKVAFQIRMRKEEGEGLQYFAYCLNERGEVVKGKKIGEDASGDSVGKGKLLVSSFIMDKWGDGEYSIISVQDQYGREYAAAIVGMQIYEAAVIPAQGMQKKYLLTVNSKKIEDEFVFAKKGGSGEWVRLPVYDGEVVVASRWEEGENTIYFMAGDVVFSHTWVQEKFGSWQGVVDWGLPSLVLMLLIYFTLKPGKGARYEIRVEEIPHREGKEIRIGRQELLSYVGVLDDFEKIMQKVCEGRGNINQDSLEMALANLVEEGELVNYRYYYAPAKKYTQKKIVCEGMKKLLCDRLVMRGVALREERGIFAGSAGSLWQVYCGQGMQELGDGKIVTVLVFEGKAVREKFEKMLSLDGRREASRLKLAIESKKLKLVCIDEV